MLRPYSVPTVTGGVSMTQTSIDLQKMNWKFEAAQVQGIVAG